MSRPRKCEDPYNMLHSILKGFKVLSDDGVVRLSYVELGDMMDYSNRHVRHFAKVLKELGIIDFKTAKGHINEFKVLK